MHLSASSGGTCDVPLPIPAPRIVPHAEVLRMMARQVRQYAQGQRRDRPLLVQAVALRRGARARGAGRPAHRRSSRSTRAGPDSDDGGSDPPPAPTAEGRPA